MQIYFLCTGNSCRSQMAEGIARKYFPEWEIASAGVERHGLNSKAVQVMAEIGINIANYQSKLIDINYLNTSDLVITLCGDAKDRCPVTPATVQKLHWGFPDPAQFQGTKEQQLEGFRRVRDDIKAKIKNFRDIQPEITL